MDDVKESMLSSALLYASFLNSRMNFIGCMWQLRQKRILPLQQNTVYHQRYPLAHPDLARNFPP